MSDMAKKYSLDVALTISLIVVVSRASSMFYYVTGFGITSRFWSHDQMIQPLLAGNDWVIDWYLGD